MSCKIFLLSKWEASGNKESLPERKMTFIFFSGVEVWVDIGQITIDDFTGNFWDFEEDLAEINKRSIIQLWRLSSVSTEILSF